MNLATAHLALVAPQDVDAQFEKVRELGSFGVLLVIFLTILVVCIKTVPSWIAKTAEQRDATLKALREEMAEERKRCDAQLACERERADDRLREQGDAVERRFQALMQRMDEHTRALQGMSSRRGT